MTQPIIYDLIYRYRKDSLYRHFWQMGISTSNDGLMCLLCGGVLLHVLFHCHGKGTVGAVQYFMCARGGGAGTEASFYWVPVIELRPVVKCVFKEASARSGSMRLLLMLNYASLSSDRHCVSVLSTATPLGAIAALLLSYILAQSTPLEKPTRPALLYG